MEQSQRKGMINMSRRRLCGIIAGTVAAVSLICGGIGYFNGVREGYDHGFKKGYRFHRFYGDFYDYTLTSSHFFGDPVWLQTDAIGDATLFVQIDPDSSIGNRTSFSRDEPYPSLVSLERAGANRLIAVDSVLEQDPSILSTESEARTRWINARHTVRRQTAAVMDSLERLYGVTEGYILN